MKMQDIIHNEKSALVNIASVWDCCKWCLGVWCGLETLGHTHAEPATGLVVQLWEQTPHSVLGASVVVVSGACYLVAAGINVSGDRWYQLLWNLLRSSDTRSRCLTKDTLYCSTVEAASWIYIVSLRKQRQSQRGGRGKGYALVWVMIKAVPHSCGNPTPNQRLPLKLRGVWNSARVLIKW